MNIAFITPEYSFLSFKNNIGGIGTFTKNLVKNHHHFKTIILPDFSLSKMVENHIEIIE